MSGTPDNQQMDEQERISELEAKVESLEAQLEPESAGGRRDFLKALGLGGLAFGAGGGTGAAAYNEMTGSARAASNNTLTVGPNGDGKILADQFGESGDPITDLYTSSQTSMTVGSLDAAELSSTRLTATEPRGGVAPTGKVSFSTEFVTEPFTDNETDPIVVHREHFDDNKYRIITADINDGSLPLYTTTDFTSFTEESADLGYFTAGGGTNFQDHIVLDDGTFVLYDSLDDTDTRVWTGDSLTNLSLDGTVVSGEADAGVLFEKPADTIHIYTEDADNAVSGEPTSNALSHYTSSPTNLTSSTQQSNAVDVTGKDWHTGDPDLIKIGEYYYMFLDNSVEHNDYNIALARSPDLYNWSVVNDNITPQNYGGDMAVTRRGGHFEGLTEFSGSDNAGIGHWSLYATPVANNLDYMGEALNITDESDGTTRASVGAQPSPGEIYTRVHEDPDTSANSTFVGYQILDTTGGIGGNWAYKPSRDKVFFDAGQGNSLVLGVRETGGSELSINPTGSTAFGRQGSNVWNLYDDQGMDQGAQDLAALSLSSTENGRIYRHDGSSSISADGGSTSSPGYYVWDNSAGEFKSMVQF